MKPLAISCLLAVMLSPALCSAQSGGKGFENKEGGRRAEVQCPKPQENISLGPMSVEEATSRLSELKIRLKIDDGQVTLWEAFIRNYIRYAEPEIVRASDYANSSALLLLQRQLSRSQNRFALAEDLNEAAKALYAILTQEQQRIVDASLSALLLDGRFLK